MTSLRGKRLLGLHLIWNGAEKSRRDRDVGLVLQRFFATGAELDGHDRTNDASAADRPSTGRC